MSENPQNIILVGASGGIGGGLLDALLQCYPQASIHASYHRHAGRLEHPRVRWQCLDARDEPAIADWAAGFERVDWLLNCAGFLHSNAGRPEKSIHAL